MLKSMTGYGSFTLDTDQLTASVEVKSLNSKFLDLSLKIPRSFNDKDTEIRNLVTKILERGKVSLSIDIIYKTEQKPKITFNKEAIKTYYQSLKEIAIEIGADTNDIYRMAFLLPETYNNNSTETNYEEEWRQLAFALEKALIECDKFRIEEGDILLHKLLEYSQKIRTNLELVVGQDPRRIIHLRERLQRQINELVNSESFDKNRFEQEMIYYIEKFDIQEEIVRLGKHLDYLEEALKSPEANGKKLGFIAQEIGRE
ncbi:MAG TPA: DUF1732 domain-containing protein, partial [Cytophagales bacterium]|nr:DUF1732 domain-containing protein [Cytophagales bacterium]